MTLEGNIITLRLRKIKRYIDISERMIFLSQTFPPKSGIFLSGFFPIKKPLIIQIQWSILIPEIIFDLLSVQFLQCWCGAHPFP